MRRALAVALLCVTHALLCVTHAARADAPPYDYLNHVRVLTGPGLVPNKPGPDATWVLSAEFSRRPLHGALATGIGFASASQLDGAWTVLTPALLVRYDLFYPFLSGGWAREPRRPFPFRVYAGLRLGVDVSESFRVAVPTPEPPYVLVRPVLSPNVDFEIPLPPSRTFVLVGRVSLDAPVSFDEVWRYAFTFGVAYAWERPSP